MDQEFYFRDIWDKLLENLKSLKNFGEEIFRLIGECKIDSFKNSHIVILCPKFLNFSVLKDNLDVVKVAFSNILHKEVDIELRLPSNFPEKKDTFTPFFFENKLNPQYTFTNFVIGKSNTQAQFASLTCASNPGSLYNPLFIYGQSGVGKTHLLNAIGNYITKNFEDMKVALISSSDFIEAVFKCGKTNSLDEFKKSMYQLDVLLIDDIQFIAGKDKTHEIFFSVFNELVSNKKQVVLTADNKPNDIKGLEERIISRFNSGLNLNIEAPEHETSVNILKMKINNNTELKKDISEDILNFLATNFSKDVRSLEGALNRFIFHSINFYNDKEITIQDCMEIFKGETKQAVEEINVDKIIKCVCNFYGFTKQQITSKSRTSKISNARQISMYLCRKLLDISYVKIGNEFGGRDHSTVMNSCIKVEDSIKTNTIFANLVKDLEKSLKT